MTNSSPSTITEPTSTIHDVELLAFAAEVGAEGAVAVRGGGTRWETGGVVESGTRVLHAPSGIVAHVADEMIVTVRAGTPVADLHAALAERGQRTSLPERQGTVGGAFMVGESSIHRLGRGHLRDSLLRARYVTAQGAPATAGGQTVKNVSGFDLCRLLVGSLGTLGLVGDVTIRTQPVPEVARWLAATDVALPSVLTLSDVSSVLWDGSTTWLHLEGFGPDVEERAGRLADTWGFSEVGGPPALPPLRIEMAPGACRDADVMSSLGTGGFVAEVGVGTVHVNELPTTTVDPDVGVVELNERVKTSFDPTRRLNPGRDTLARVHLVRPLR